MKITQRHSFKRYAFIALLFSTSTVFAQSDFEEISLVNNISVLKTSTARLPTVKIPARCNEHSEIDNIAHQLELYFYLASQGTEHAHSFNYVISKGLGFPPGDNCYQWAASFYALNSLYSYIPSDTSFKTSTELQVVFQIAKELFVQKRLVPLTQKLRQKWGGRWNDPTHLRVIGAYQCEDGVIYFDPTLPPYNLAGSLMHEIEHLARDKTFYWDHPDVYFRDTATTLLLDETLSTLQTGYLQLSLIKDSNRSKANHAGASRSFEEFLDDGRIINPHVHYQIIGDLNYFDPKGNLVKLWKKQVRKYGLEKGSSLSFFLSQSLFRDPNKTGGFEVKHFTNIIHLINENFFENEGPDSQLALEELRFWNQSTQDSISSLTSNHLAPRTLADLILSRIKIASPGCLKITAAIEKHELSHYIGSQLKTDQGNGNPSEGVRTGAPVAPSEGVRTHIPLSPCLNLEQKI